MSRHTHRTHLNPSATCFVVVVSLLLCFAMQIATHRRAWAADPSPGTAVRRRAGAPRWWIGATPRWSCGGPPRSAWSAAGPRRSSPWLSCTHVRWFPLTLLLIGPDGTFDCAQMSNAFGLRRAAGADSLRIHSLPALLRVC